MVARIEAGGPPRATITIEDGGEMNINLHVDFYPTVPPEGCDPTSLPISHRVIMEMLRWVMTNPAAMVEGLDKARFRCPKGREKGNGSKS